MHDPHTRLPTPWDTVRSWATVDTVVYLGFAVVSVALIGALFCVKIAIWRGLLGVSQ